VNKKFDIICMGRAAVDLYSDDIGVALEDVSRFSKYLGGCPANIAVGCARLGLRTAMITRVGDEAMGRFVRKALLKEGVDVSFVKTDSKRLTGLVILGIDPPDKFPLIFYRENCADMAICREDITGEFLSQSHSLLISGTQCSQEESFSVVKYAIDQGKKLGLKIILDIDYRPVLWKVSGHGEGENRYVENPNFSKRIGEIIPECNLIVGTEEEFIAAGNVRNVADAVIAIRKKTSAILVLKKGEKGCEVYYPGNFDSLQSTPFPITVLNVLGAGDAFLSGFLSGFLKNLPLEMCAKLGNANGALVVTRHGCSPAMPFKEELQLFIENPGNLDKVNELHITIENSRDLKIISLLAFDHRTYFKELALHHNEDEHTISEFKKLIFESFQKIPQIDGITYGIIADEEYPIDKEFLSFRCIEKPESSPLEFIGERNAKEILNDRPKEQNVKVLCYIDEDMQSVEKLKELYCATQESGRSLLIELIDRDVIFGLQRVVAVIDMCLQKEIFPDWWKLQPIHDEDSWKRIARLIDTAKIPPKGVLLLGGNQSPKELKKNLRTLSEKYPFIKGSAIGRTVWGEAAIKWFAKHIDDREAMAMIQKEFLSLTEISPSNL